MIKVYENGNEFKLENKEFLDLNKYMSSLFYVNANTLTKTDTINYAIKAEDGNKKTLAIRVEPYNLLLYGDIECLGELLGYLYNNKYVFSGIMCNTTIGDELVKSHDYIQKFGMDFMEAKEYSLESSKEVLKATLDDLDQVYECVNKFFKDCGLPDTMDKDRLATKLDNFRLIKENERIVSLATYMYDTENSFRVSHVYTRPECRGKGNARKVVNYIKNEILEMGKVATLNVDQKNPISNHLYLSLGFKKIYSQGIYSLKKN